MSGVDFNNTQVQDAIDRLIDEMRKNSDVINANTLQWKAAQESSIEQFLSSKGLEEDEIELYKSGMQKAYASQYNEVYDNLE